MNDLDEILNYYVNLLIIQYSGQPKAQATIRLLINVLLANNVIFDVRDGFNVDTAIGVQLDTVGEWVDVDRFYNGQDLTDEFFGLANAVSPGDVSANIVGFNDADDGLIKDGEFLDATRIISNGLRLNDDAFRILIKLKIIQNNINHSMGELSSSLFRLFGTDLIAKDNYDMTMTYFVDNISEPLLNAIFQKDLFIRPMAVAINYLINRGDYFGFADATIPAGVDPFIIGFNDATVGLIKDGSFIDANQLIYTEDLI